MSNKKFKGLYDDLCQFIVNKKDEVTPVPELWLLYHKYVEYQNLKQMCRELNQVVIRNNLNDHKILYFLLENLYMANCSDLDLISEVIKRFHTEEIQFSHIISDLFNEFKNFETDEIIQLLEYCLKYAYKKKLLFDGFRMATFSHFFQLSLTKIYYTPFLPKVLGILLRYGMLLDPINGQTPPICNFRCNSEILQSVIKQWNLDWVSIWISFIEEGIVVQNPKLLPVNELPDKQKQILNVSVEVAKLVLRDSAQLKLTNFHFSMLKKTLLEENLNIQDILGEERKVFQFKPADVIDFVQKLGHFVHELPFRCFEPISLKHSCKRTIRRILHLNWQLPNGIFNLDVPNSLMRYLNLEID